MTVLDSQLRPAVAELAAELGFELKLRRTTRTFDNVTNMETGTPSVAEYPLRAVPPSEFEYSTIDGVNVVHGDMKLLLPAADSDGNDVVVEPSAETDVLIFDNRRWKIVRVMRIWSGEQVAAYELQVRAA